MARMSIEQREWIVKIVQSSFKLVLVFTAYLCTTIFMDIRNDIREVKDSMTVLKERLIVVEVQLQEKYKKR